MKLMLPLAIVVITYTLSSDGRMGRRRAVPIHHVAAHATNHNAHTERFSLGHEGARAGGQPCLAT